eukprot:CAMPEP_0115856392 /NCGR_PEP_ID=MMETSP0287-20121206/15029_1 /TAXON_ID=412157 /ORGANISM="Chrysochromulina rotalis, Strain UIO044" /LENGTH=116 /DNA_ID=CAMNT_0003310565 /DNA_START=42 /DNA_END=392 /DNA_ORIENTATION=-
MTPVHPELGDPRVLSPTPRRLRPWAQPDERMEQSSTRNDALEEKVEDLECKVRDLQRTLENTVLSLTIISRASSSQQTSQGSSSTACQHNDISTNGVERQSGLISPPSDGGPDHVP